MTNPLEDYQQSKEAAREARKKNEIELWQRWQEGGQQPEHLQPLLKLYEPVIAQKARQWKAPMVPASAFKAELQKHLIKAFQVYDPTKGAAINTHVEKRLKKAMRFNNRYQNLAYIPEQQSGLIGKIQRAQTELTEQFGRPPTTDELSEHLGQSPKRITTVLKAQKNDIPMSRSGGENYDYASNADRGMRGFEDQQIAVAAKILPKIFPNKPDMHELFHYTFGTNDYPQVLHTKELAKRMGKKEPQIARMKTIMGKTLREQMGLPELDDEEDDD